MPAPKPQRFKEAIYQQLARISKAMASPRRLELLDLLAQGPQTVERLAGKTRQSVANTSQHLQRLRRARLVEAEKRGLYVTYRLPDERVAEFYRAQRLLAEARLAEIEELTRDFLSTRGGLEPVDREALIRRVLHGDVTLLDVRPVEEYQAGHIPGAVQHGGEVALCGSCLDARGINAAELLQGTRRGSLEELTDWTLWADRVITF